MNLLRCGGFSLALIAGIALGMETERSIPAVLLVLTAGGGLGASLFFLWRERRFQETAGWLVLLAAVAAGLPLGFWRARAVAVPAGPHDLRNRLSMLPPGAELLLQGVVAEEPELRGTGRVDLRLRVDRYRRVEEENWRVVAPRDVLLRVAPSRRREGRERAARALLRLASPEAYADRIEVRTRYRPPRVRGNPGAFDMEAYLLQNGFVHEFRASIDGLTVVDGATGAAWMEMAYAAKAHCMRLFKATIRAPESRLAAAAVLGYRRALEGVEVEGMDMTAAFRRAGVGHVLAVSGLHVTIISILLFAVFRLTGLRPRTFAPALIFLLLLFALLTGARPSAVRAVVMNSVVIVAYAYFRCLLREATAIGLGLSACVILLHNPPVLFSPSFLLSYGAVLSLLLLSGPLDAWLCRLHGFSLLFAVLWLGAVWGLAAYVPWLVCRGDVWLLLAGVLGLLGWSGERLNQHFPWAWRLGWTRLPQTPRIFLAAQLAIQIGMVVPLSAWFFGRLPVAGVLINLVAIPAIGVFVQCGALVSLVGLVPWVGTVLAAPLGAATTLCGSFFFWLAHAGATAVPFPPLPRPSPAWLAGYYAAVALALVLHGQRAHLAGWLYRLWQRAPRWLWRCALGVPVLLVAGGLWGVLAPHRVAGITVLAEGSRAPCLVVASTGREGLCVNPQGGWGGSRQVFAAARTAGTVSFEAVILCSPAPRFGLEGAAELVGEMPCRACYLPLLASSGQDYLALLQDAYLSRKAREGERWARAYSETYDTLLAALAREGVRVRPLPAGRVVRWRDLEVEALPRLEVLPERYATAAQAAFLQLRVHRFRWLVVTETVPAALEGVPPEPVDVLVLPAGHSMRSWSDVVEGLVDRTRPRLVVFTGSPGKGFSPAAWRDECTVAATAQEGALRFFFPTADRMDVEGFVSGRRFSLSAR